jgi:hypothetical protein
LIEEGRDLYILHLKKIQLLHPKKIQLLHPKKIQLLIKIDQILFLLVFLLKLKADFEATLDTGTARISQAIRASCGYLAADLFQKS